MRRSDSLPSISPRFVSCPPQWQEQFFQFFGDVGGLLSTTRSLTIWTLSNGFDLLSSRHPNVFGIAFLSGPIWDRAKRVTQACHLERIVPKTRPPNWPYRRFYRSPLSVPLGTSLGAPWKGAKATCKRWQDRSVASDNRDPVAESPPVGNRRRTRVVLACCCCGALGLGRLAATWADKSGLGSGTERG